MKDMKKYRGFGTFLYHHKEIFDQLPRLASFAGREMITVNGVGKKEKQKLIFGKIRKDFSMLKLLRLFWEGWRAVK